jgi:tetratricopeptide (TPR) repeat protein
MISAHVCGCRSTTPWPDIERRLGGELRRGPVVSPEAYAHFIRAEHAATEERWAAASTEYQRAHELSGEDPYLISRWTAALYQSGERERAHALLQQAEERSPQSEALRLARARIVAQGGQLAHARELIREAILLEPLSERGPLLMAQLAELDAEREPAIIALETTLERRGTGSLAAWRALFTLSIAARDASRTRRCLQVLGRDFHGVFVARSDAWQELLNLQARSYVCSISTSRPSTFREQIDCP